MGRQRKYYYDDDFNRQPGVTFGDILICCVLLALVGLAAIYVGKEHDRRGQRDCQLCHSPRVQQQQRLAGYLRAKGNPTPEALAEAVMHTRSPRLMAAIAVRGEKNTPYWIRCGGRGHRHAGAWQVNEKIHGRVPYELTEQALQAELVLTDMTTGHRGNIRKALNNYGGDTRGRYARNVLAELEGVPR